MKVPTRTSIGVLPTNEGFRGNTGAGGTPEAFGAGVGQSLMRVAGETAAFGVFLQQQEEQRNRFDALTRFTAFERDQKLSLENRSRNTAPGQNGLYEQTAGEYTTAEKEFISTLPPDLQDEFRVRTSELGANLGLTAAKTQYEMNDTYYKEQLQSAFDTARLEISQDPSSLETQRVAIAEKIAASGLGAAEQVSIARKVNAGLEAVAYREAQVARLREEAAGLGSDVDQAMQSLTDQGMTEAEAFSAVTTAQSSLATAVGEPWATLPARVRAVLTEAVVTDGLSEEVVAAIQGGDLAEIADALRQSGAETFGDLIENPEAGIDNDPAFANVPYEDRLALIADAERTVAAEVTAQQQQAKAETQSMVNSLHVALYDGTAGQADIDASREAGILTDYEDIKKADDILAKRDEELRLRQIGLNIMSGASVFRPGNEDDKKVLNAMVGPQGIEALDAKNSQYAANVLIPIINKAQAVPTDVVNQLAGMVRSQDGDRAYWALDLMGQIERSSPMAFSQFSQDDRMAVDFWQARRDYIPQDELMQKLRGPMDPAERNARIAMRKVGQELFTAEQGPLKGFDATSLIAGPGWFGSGASAPATKWVGQQLNEDFRTLFLDNYELYGDVAGAKDAASKQLQRVWGTTSVGKDGAIMKYPPEKAYSPVAGSYNWMEEQLRAEGILADGEQFELITDTQTENEWQTGTPPSYILAKIVDGRTEVIINNAAMPPDERQGVGLPLRVWFDHTPLQIADELAWRQERAAAKQLEDEDRILGDALSHEAETGTPVPTSLLMEYARRGLTGDQTPLAGGGF